MSRPRLARGQEAARRRRQFEARRNAVERQIAELQATLEQEAEEVAALSSEAAEHEARLVRDRVDDGCEPRSG